MKAKRTTEDQFFWSLERGEGEGLELPQNTPGAFGREKSSVELARLFKNGLLSEEAYTTAINRGRKGEQ